MIELACGDHGNDKIGIMAKEIENGKCLVWTGISDLLAIDQTGIIDKYCDVVINYIPIVGKPKNTFVLIFPFDH